MKLKLTEAGAVAVLDGKPVYVADDGKEVAFDYAATLATIGRLNGEAKGHRERAETAEGALKAFDGITDPAAAIKALGTVKNLADKQLLEAGEVDVIKAAAIKAVEEKWRPVAKERDELKGALTREIVGGSFSRSKYIADKLAIPADLAEAAFSRHFSVVDGKMVAKGADGNPIFSRARPGEAATFDEALEFLVDAYPHRDTILKGTGASGGGTPPGGSLVNGKKTMTRAAFSALPPMDQAKTIKEYTLTD